MVVSRLPAGCCVDASASRPLDSASAATSAYQRPATSCPLANFFPFASVCWLVIASPLVASPPPYVAFCHTAASPVHPRPPLFVRAGWLLRRILSHRLRAPPADMLPRAAPSPYIRQLALSCTAIFVAPSLGAAAIAGILKCTAHSPGAASPTATVPFRTALVLQHVHLRAGSRVASCGIFTLNLSHRHCRRPLSRRRGHRRRPQMHRALSRRRHRQRPLFPLMALVIQHVHLPSLPNSRHILEEGDDVEAFYVCVKFTL